IGWLLLRRVEVKTFADACDRVGWSTCRWVIEMLPKVLKEGGRVEGRPLEAAERIEGYLALDSIVAWRVLYLTLMGRGRSERSCRAILEAHEWEELYCFIHRKAEPPTEPPTLGEAVRWIGRLGRFLGRQGDGEGGIVVMWRGLQRLHDIAATWQIVRPQAVPP
ncbi:MAG: IS4 family transposase, partial [Abditibacteriales bacterium]|nr:IS4 family transposase [Abditibacteriales bacterium]